MLGAIMNPAPVIAVGLEAADPDLLERWCAEGALPNFSRLRAEGGYRRLRSCTEVSSGATWPSITTGVSPGRHGMGFYHRQLRNGTYRIVKKYADELRSPFFWQAASDAGRRVLVFDIPVTYPLAAFSGAQIVGWGAEGLNWRQCSEPGGLLSEIHRRFGRHPLDGWYQREIRDASEWIELRDRLREGTRRRTRIVRWLLERERWDLAIVGYPEPHWAGHYFFHLWDPSHPRHDPDAARACRDAILEVYRDVDAAIGEVREARPDAAVLVFSNTGMGVNYSGLHLLPEVLDRLGMSGRRGHRGGNGGRRPRWGSYAIRTVESLVSAKNIERARRLVPARVWDKYTRILLTLGNGWPRSRAFAVPGDFTGSIRINLKGREPDGTVAPGPEFERLCEELEEALLELVNPATGRAAVQDVFRFRDRYPGPCADEFPDLIVQWEGSAPIDALRSARIGTVTGEIPDKRSGAHRTWGFLVAAGEPIRRSGTLPPANILDIAPTLLQLQGLAAPASMEGRVLADLIVDPA